MTKRHYIGMAATAAVLLLFYLATEGKTGSFLLSSAIIMLVLAAIAAFGGGRHLTWHIAAPSRTEKGQSAEVKITIKNDSRFSVFSCDVTLSIRNLLTGDDAEERFSFATGGGKTVVFPFSVQNELCGCAELSIKEVRVGDPFRLLTRKRPVQARASVYCFPRPAQLPLQDDAFEAYDMESFRYSAARRGDDPSDIFAIRSYMPGDSMKAIHWKLSGKLGDVQVKEYGLPVDSKLLILLDRDMEPEQELTAQQRSNAAELSISLSYTLWQRGLSHCVGWYDYRFSQFVTKPVASENDFWESAREILCAPYAADESSTVAHLIAANEEKPYGSYVWITYTQRDKERLMQYGQVNVYEPASFLSEE